jgi:hypothetical protein
MTGIVKKCTLADDKASGQAPSPSRVVTVYMGYEAGQTVASQRLPLRMSGARYRMRLLRGAYSISVASPQGDAALVYVPADMTSEVDLWCVR